MLAKPFPGPDLVVQSIQATRNNVRLVIKNQGTEPVQNGFFVDVYIDPSTVPTHVNQTWSDVGAKEGLVWGVQGSALQKLGPGGSITLEYNGTYYLAEYSAFSGSLNPGTPIYAQADSFNDPDPEGVGTVLEVHEEFGGEYNNILGPVFSTAALSSHSLTWHPTDPARYASPLGRSPQEALDTLPARP